MPRWRAVGHDLEKRIPAAQLAEHPRGLVARAVVHHDHLEAEAGGAERLGAAREELGQVRRLVLGRHQHADVEGSAEPTAVIRACASCAGRMPSWSRYLATVRRAIWMPCSWKRWTICWSVSGLDGFSSATIFSSLARMDRALASSPEAVARALEKKNLSGSTPRGVCTYFSLVTRLTVLSCMLITSATSRRVSGLQILDPLLEEVALPVHDEVHDLEHRLAALLDRLDHPVGAVHLGGDELAILLA